MDALCFEERQQCGATGRMTDIRRTHLYTNHALVSFDEPPKCGKIFIIAMALHTAMHSASSSTLDSTRIEGGAPV